MADIVLGARPKTVEVILTKDADFFTTLTKEDGTDWSAGTQIKLTIGSSSFDAIIDGPDAHFSIDSTIVNQLIAKRTHNILAKLFYINGLTEICWAVGAVNANG